MSIFDAIVVVILVFVMGVACITGMIVLNSFESNPEVNATLSGSPEAMQAVSQGKNVLLMFDTLAGVLVIGAFIAALVSAFVVRSHPIFFFVSFIVTLILVVISAVLSNAWHIFAINEVIAPTANQFILTGYLFSNLPLIVCVISFTIAIVQHGRGTTAPGGI